MLINRQPRFRLIYVPPANAPEGQCDCACAEAVTARQLPSVSATCGRFEAVSGLIESPLTAHDIALYSPFTNYVALVNPSALVLFGQFKSPRSLKDAHNAPHNQSLESAIDNTLYDLVHSRFLQIEGTHPLTPVEYPTSLSAWLHITDRCNLRCAYCYLPHDGVDMSAETGRAAIEATFRSAIIHGYRRLKLKYSGGEPLLRFPLIEELHHYAQTLTERHSLTLDGVILSNGTLLTSQTVDRIRSLGLRLMVSLDGLGDFHDRQRHYANGRGSYADVFQSVQLAVDRGLVPDISITVSGRNAEGLPDLIAWVLERDLPFSFNFYRENDLSTPNEDLRLKEEAILTGMLEAFKIIEANLPRRSLLASLLDRANLSVPHLRTCGVGQSYLVFDHKGNVSKCHMQIGQPVTTFDVVEDPLSLIRADQSGIQNKSVEEKEDCQFCKWKYWCTGGCPFATYRSALRYDSKSPNCNIYKALFPEVLRLEGLRLLKYADEIKDANGRSESVGLMK